MGKPLGTNIRIEIYKSPSSLAMEMVDEKDTRIEKAKVLECGYEVTKVTEGQEILFKAYNLDEIEIGNEKYILIPEEDVKYAWNISTTTEK